MDTEKIKKIILSCIDIRRPKDGGELWTYVSALNVNRDDFKRCFTELRRENRFSIDHDADRLITIPAGGGTADGPSQRFEKNKAAVLAEIEKKAEPNNEETYEEVTLNDVETTIKKNFPSLWRSTKICFSTIAVLLLEDAKEPLGINLIGSPSSGKGTTLSFFYPIPNITYQSDSFTPQSFVTHMRIKNVEKLEQIDMLPKIKNKCMVVPELAPIFGARKDDRLKNISLLTRVFDGQGLLTDSGIYGQRGYHGEYMFAWLGASTPFSAAIWRLMEKLGQRWLFFNMPKNEKGEDELIDEIIGSQTYKDKIKECHKAVNNYLQTLFHKHKVGTIKWERKETAQVKIIVKLAQLLAKLRAYVLISATKTESGEDFYHYTMPMIEDPERIMSKLYNLARGHAIINGRNEINDEDLKILIPIVLSSAPYERTLLIVELLDSGGTLYSSDIQDKLNCSQSSASRLMKMFNVLQICDYKSADVRDEDGRPLGFIELKEDLKWFIGDRFKFLQKGGQEKLN